MTVQRVGYFRELGHGDPEGPSLREALGVGDESEAARIADYLEDGAGVAATTAPAVDVVDPQHPVLGSVSIRTDGEWVWPSDLAHYVRRYAVALPHQFVETVRERGYRAPRLTEDQLDALIDELIEG